jgi:hypothetical protein
MTGKCVVQIVESWEGFKCWHPLGGWQRSLAHAMDLKVLTTMDLQMLFTSQLRFFSEATAGNLAQSVGKVW